MEAPVPETPRELLTRHHRRLYLAVRALVRSAEAEAVLREVVVAWPVGPRKPTPRS